MTPEPPADSRSVSPVVDRYPEGIPPLMSDRLRSVMRDALADGVPASDVYERLADERVREFGSDPAFRERVREHLESAGVDAICATAISFGMHDSQGKKGVYRSLGRLQAYVDAADWLGKACSPADFRSEDVTLFVGMEDTVALEGNVNRIDELYNFGVRAMQLAYQERNLVGSGCMAREDAGLSEFGLCVIDRLNELGIVVDLSHCGDRTTREAIDHSARPPAFTHVLCRSLRDHPRGKPDDQITAVADADGYVGIVAVPYFIGDSGGIEALVNHVDHAVNLAGVDHVGIVTNWGIWTPDMPAELRDGLVDDPESHVSEIDHDRQLGAHVPPMTSYTEWAKIPESLRRRGYSRSDVRGLCGENFVSYFDRTTT